MHILQILLLAIIQGAAELLPVSSSAHVTVVARLIGFDRGSDFAWTFLLIMLHTGTMFAVLVYFRSRWKGLTGQAPALAIATVCTLAVGYLLKKLIEHFFLGTDSAGDQQEIEHLFFNLPLIAAALAAVGVLILIAGFKDKRSPGRLTTIGRWPSVVIGAVQGLCIPFRGFSRSGATISTSMFFGIERIQAEEFSFALAVLLTPFAVGWEVKNMLHERADMLKAQAAMLQEHAAQAVAVPSLASLFLPALLGMVFSFMAGLVALRVLSRWMEKGHWQWFGFYCLAAAAVVLAIHYRFIPC